MINLTEIARIFMRARVNAASRWADPDGMERTQRRVLERLLSRAADTVVGRRYGFRFLGGYENFAARVPVVAYEDIRPEVERMVHGERDVLWPGLTRNFAQSSGTSGGKSKYIPVTEEGLRRNHYAGTRDVVANYLALYPESRLFGGRSFILGGSFANELGGLPHGVRVGDLSATLIDRIPAVAEFYRVPSRRVALMSDWSEKLPALVDAAIGQDITNISGVPSWFLTVLRAVMAKAGADTIHDVWPNLEVFFHGGIAFGPYREQYRAITDPAKMRYLETYNASEGFFACADTIDGKGMRLLADNGVFFEFLPVDSDGDPHPEALPAWKVEPGQVYALAITSCNGLWRYAIGDTVRVESVEPLRITVAGRTKCFINAFGEELMVHNTDTAIAETCAATAAAVADYTVAPVYTDAHRRGRHQWLVEWASEPQGGTDAFAAELDRRLCALNSDYQAKRAGTIFLDGPEIVSLPAGSFDRWLARTGKLGGQRKVPRLSNDRHIADEILAHEYKQNDIPTRKR
ncbi:MAG: GH3 auxin-responsive promoter family protein [Muribaculaceae bacterium]|nr:GH3 auxin-responsive promoter family protein [Muribaculaceae bacterium]